MSTEPTTVEIITHQKKLRALPQVWIVTDTEGISCGVFESKDAATLYRDWCKAKFKHSYGVHSEPLRTEEIVREWCVP